MNKSSPAKRSALRAVTRRLLDSDAPAWSLHEPVREMVTLIDEGATVAREKLIGSGETHTHSGLAVSPTMAIMCTDDFLRTIIFMRGVRQAVQSARQKNPGRPVRVLYAGCGPYGVLAVPLMSVLGDGELSVTFLDIHATSIRAIESVIAHFGLEPSVGACETTDAMNYRIPAGETPDVIVLELMQAILSAEPQVAVTRHLLSQAPDAILVPEEIRIDLMLVDSSREFHLINEEEGDTEPPERDRVLLGTAFTVDRQIVHSTEQGGGTPWLTGGLVQVPEEIEDRYEFMLSTRIRTQGDHLLRDHDSGLTTPRRPCRKRPIQPGQRLQFRYLLGDRPALHFHVEEEESEENGRTGTT